MDFDAKINSTQQLTTLLTKLAIHTFKDACYYVAKLPYARNSNRHDLSLVLSERQGTCSSKHAFLKQVAIENKLDQVQLILCIYKMNKKNTPKIGTTLLDKLTYIPEAHCYLKIAECVYDFTNVESDPELIKSAILEEIQIEPLQVNDFKLNYHKRFLQTWIESNGIPYSLAEVWNIREDCITAISNA